MNERQKRLDNLDRAVSDLVYGTGSYVGSISHLKEAYVAMEGPDLQDREPTPPDSGWILVRINRRNGECFNKRVVICDHEGAKDHLREAAEKHRGLMDKREYDESYSWHLDDVSIR